MPTGKWASTGRLDRAGAIVGRAVGWLALPTALALIPSAARAQLLFTDVSATSGFSGAPLVTESLHALGITWFDFDDDGFEDLFIVNGKGHSKELYRNRGDATFELRSDLLPTLPDVELMGAVAGDYDNDGDPDLYVFASHEDHHFNRGPLDGPLNLLLANQFVENGRTLRSPNFVDRAVQAGVDLPAVPPLGNDYPGYRSAIGGFLDADRDGWLDLYVGQWAMPAPKGTSDANQDRLFRNRGDGRFVDATASFGLPVVGDPQKRLRPTLGFIAAHLDDDLWPDLYVGHTGVVRAEAIDRVYFHDGVGAYIDGNAASPAGFGDDATANMGVIAADIENDGDFDLYMSDLIFPFDPACNPLYLNNGDGTFTDDVAAASGVEADDSWAVIFADLDQDGFVDLFVGTTIKAAHTNFLYHNRGDTTFADVSAASGVSFPGHTFGGAAADYDRDGDLDLAWVDEYLDPSQPGGIKLLRNDSPNQGHWLQVKLLGVASNRSAIGSRVTARVGKQRYLRQVVGGAGAHGQDQLAVHFGLGAATQVDELTIEWPSGAVNTWRNVAVDQFLVLEEQVVTHLALSADPNDVGPGETLTFATSGGAPGMLMMLAAVAVDGVPLFLTVDVGSFDGTGTRSLVVDVPDCLAGFDVDFQSVGFEAWNARVGWSGVASVHFH